MLNPATLSGHIQVGQDMSTPVVIHATYSMYDTDTRTTSYFEVDTQTDGEGLYSLAMHTGARPTIVFTHPSFSVMMEVGLRYTEETLTITQSDIHTSISVFSTEWEASSYYVVENNRPSYTSHTLFGNEYTTLIVGNNQGNNILGHGNDTIYGMGGGDTLRLGGTRSTAYGGEGNDVYYAGYGDTVVEYLDEGVDTVYTSGNFTLPDNVENLRYGNFSGGTATGNSLNNTMYYGSFRVSHFLGMAGNDTVFGGSSDDTLDGGTGDDHLYGGKGDQTFVVDSAQDVVVEEEDGGVDVVHALFWNDTMNLYDYVENLVLLGDQELPGTGNGLANTLTGNSGNNILDGLDGNDSLWGADGQDTLMGGQGADRIYGGNGDDSLHGSVGQDKLFGGIGNDTLLGEGSNDRLNSGHGGDSLLGGTGLDTLDGGSGNDILNGGEDDDLLWGATGLDTLLGDNGNDTLHGGNWTDTLYGGNGDDLLSGGQSNDVLFGGAGADRFLFATETGKDTVIDFIRSEGDRLVFNAGAFSPGTNTEDIIALHTTVADGVTTIAFNGGTVRIDGVTDITVEDLMFL